MTVLLAGLAAGLPAARAAAAQPAPPPGAGVLENLADRPVREIVVRSPEGVEPLSREARDMALNNIRTAAGAPLRIETLNDDVDRLNRLGRFARVEARVQRFDDGSVAAIFEVVEQPIVQDVQAVGNTRIPDRRIAEAVDVLVGAPVDRFQVDRAARRIENLYRAQGFYLAEVTVDEEELAESGIVLFRIREGERVRITDIRFEGNEAFADRILRREVDTEEYVPLIRKGAVEDETLDSDVGNLIRFYRDRGYLDVRADRVIRPSPDGREAIVTFLIEEGPLYTLRSVTLNHLDAGEAERVYTDGQILGLLTLKPGDVYALTELRRSLEAVSNAYGKLGFTDARIVRRELRDPAAPIVDLRLDITQGQRFRTGEVIIQGNEITQHKVIRRHVEVRPDRPLDTTAIARSRQRLDRMRIFAPGSVNITLQPPDPADPEYRDVLVEVEETNTGSFALGGAVSSDSGVVGRIALTQRNFDITDTPDSFGDLFSGRAFRGGGQTLQVEALPGDRSETYSISLSEPYLFETDYSGSGSIYYRSRDYRQYDEVRVGARLGLGRRFGTLWTGGVSLRVEGIELEDIEEDRPVDIFEVEGSNHITGIGFTLSRNTLDDPYRPTRGAATRAGIEQVGALGGDFTFTSIDAEHRVFIPLRRDYLDRATVLSLTTRVGYIPQGQDDVPIFERYYLGGQSFRGFDFRTVSPKGIRNDTGEQGDDPIGGTWLFFAGLELNQPIFEDTLSLVFFVDTGTVLEEPGFEDYRVSVGVGIRFYVPQLSPAPLAFDFGFPILDADLDEDRLFTFSIDLPL